MDKFPDGGHSNLPFERGQSTRGVFPRHELVLFGSDNSRPFPDFITPTIRTASVGCSTKLRGHQPDGSSRTRCSL
jgi:hypothetical protein